MKLRWALQLSWIQKWIRVCLKSRKYLISNDMRYIRILLCFALVNLIVRTHLGSASSESPSNFYESGELSLTPNYPPDFTGPLYGRSRLGSQTGWTISPLFSYRTDPIADFTGFELAYPLVTYHRFGSERRFQILQFFSFGGGMTLSGHTTRRFTLFPFYFQQRSSDPSLNYKALFPVYGQLKNRLFRDEIRFFLFPLYGESKKRDILTQNLLYPFFHRRSGPGLRGLQFWPLAGLEQLEPSTRTNILGEVEVVGGHRKIFFLWPFFFQNRLGEGTENPEKQDIFLPFYSLQRSPKRDVSSYLWPLGPTFIDDREKKYREWGFPWPFVTFARGEGKTSNRIWPLFSRSKNESLESGFFLWPIIKYNRIDAEPLYRQRNRVLLFLYSDLVERNTVEETEFRRIDLWPLFSKRTEHDGSERFQTLALLEPFLPTSQDIERVYSPLWTFFLFERNAKSGKETKSILWNLYRTEKTLNTRKCSLLFGLFHYQSGPEGSRWRLFYIPIRSVRQP